jgi:GT2 family glycosyltransferase
MSEGIQTPVPDEVTASVVLATYQKRDYLPLTLAALALQDHDAFEVIVVDDGTPGGVEDIVERSRRHGLDRIELVRQANGGRAAARNAALAASSGQVVIFCDDDRIAAPDFVRRHVEMARMPGIASIGWKRRALTRWIPGALPLGESEFFRVRDLVPDVLAAHQLVTVEEFLQDPQSLRGVDFGDEPDNYADIADEFGDSLSGFRFGWALGTTASLAVLRESLVEAGGVDERFTGWGIEDTELCYRLSLAGIAFRMNRAAINHHQIHPTEFAGHPAAMHIQRRQLRRTSSVGAGNTP